MLKTKLSAPKKDKRVVDVAAIRKRIADAADRKTKEEAMKKAALAKPKPKPKAVSTVPKPPPSHAAATAIQRKVGIPASLIFNMLISQIILLDNVLQSYALTLYISQEDNALKYEVYRIYVLAYTKIENRVILESE